MRKLISYQKRPLYKKKKKKLGMGVTLLNALPEDLVISIMTNVSAGSLTDFFNLKLCCSNFKTLAEEKYTYKCISLQSLPLLDWKGRSTEFIKNCVENNNPEALYREGVIGFFGLCEFETGLKYLKAAIDEGYLQACYVLAMIFIFNNGGGEEGVMQLGFELLGRVCEARKEIVCREKMTNDVYKHFWPNLDHTWFIQTKPDERCIKKHRRKTHKWLEEYIYFEDPDCIPCRCDAEIDRFNKTFDWRRYPFYYPA